MRKSVCIYDKGASDTSQSGLGQRDIREYRRGESLNQYNSSTRFKPQQEQAQIFVVKFKFNIDAQASGTNVRL